MKTARELQVENSLSRVGGLRMGRLKFRHTLATAMLENGADIRYIQEMLGHSKSTTTQIYAKVSLGKSKDVHRATHPVEG